MATLTEKVDRLLEDVAKITQKLEDGWHTPHDCELKKDVELLKAWRTGIIAVGTFIVVVVLPALWILLPIRGK